MDFLALGGRRCVVLLLALLVYTFGCAAGTRDAWTELPEGAAASELNAEPYFKNPLFSHVALSPDGTRLAAIREVEGIEILVVWPTAGGPIGLVAKLERTRRRSSEQVRKVMWANDEVLLVSIEMPSASAVGVRARQTRLLSVSADGGKPKYLGEKWPHQEYSQTQDRIVHRLPNDPDQVLIGLWVPDEKGVGVRRLNIHSGRLNPVVRPRLGSLWWAADHNGVVRAGGGEASNSNRKFISARTNGKERFDEIQNWDPFKEDGFSLAAFSADPNELYVYQQSEDRRTALYRYDLSKRKVGAEIFAHPEFDVDGVTSSAEDGRLLSVHYEAEKPQVEYLDESAGKVGRGLQKAFAGENIRIMSEDEIERYAVVSVSSDIRAPRFYLYDRQTKTLQHLFTAYEGLDDVVHSPMEPIRYAARDGLEIHGYLTTPQGGEAPYPTIVLPHGGPWARDTWGWNAEVQYLASLGFAVLQPNFRGSDGYGEEFLLRGRGRWGLEMQDDVTDGVRWLIEEGVADVNRVGIYGVSYGGYAALLGLVREPNLFKAGASFAGVTDLPSLLSDEGWYYSRRQEMEALVGDRWSDRERLRDSSPARQAQKIRVPVFIAHGTEDPRVHVRQAEMMRDALEDAGVPVETHLYGGEVHGFLDERNRIDFYERLGTFFLRHLAAPEVGAEALR